MNLIPYFIDRSALGPCRRVTALKFDTAFRLYGKECPLFWLAAEKTSVPCRSYALHNPYHNVWWMGAATLLYIYNGNGDDDDDNNDDG